MILLTPSFQGQSVRQIGNVSNQVMLVMEMLKLGPPDPA